MGFDLKYNDEVIHTFDVDPRTVKAVIINDNFEVPVQFDQVELKVELKVLSPADAEFQKALKDNLSPADEVAAMETILGPEPEPVETPKIDSEGNIIDETSTDEEVPVDEEQKQDDTSQSSMFSV